MKNTRKDQDLERAIILRTFKRFLSNYPSVFFYPILVPILFWKDYPYPEILTIWTLLILSMYQWRRHIFKSAVVAIKNNKVDFDITKMWGRIKQASILTGILWAFAGFLFFTPNNLFLVGVLYVILLGFIIVNMITGSAFPKVHFLLFATPIAIAVFVRIIMFWGYTASAIYLLVVGLYFFAFSKVTKAILSDEENLLKTQLNNYKLIEDLSIKTKEAQKANTDKSKFLAAASHDLRQPLHAISLFLYALSDEIKTKKGQHLLLQLDKSTADMGDLFNALLDLSKLDSGAMEVNQKVFTIKPLLENILKEFSESANKKNLL